MSAATTTFDKIVQLIQSSNLNFKLQLSPFAANISLKKTPVKDRFGKPFLPQAVDPGADAVAALVTRNLELERELLKVKGEHAAALDDCKTIRETLTKVKIEPDHCPNQELLESKLLVDKLYEEVAKLVKENKQLGSTIGHKNDEIRDLERRDKVKGEAFAKLNKEMKDLKIKFNKEKNEISKSHKSEVKSWRNELGEEIKKNIKLREKLKDLDIFEESKPDASKKKPTKKKADIKSKSVKKIEENICSICGIDIVDYIPEYFMGEKYNPACLRCKASDSSWNPDDPFSSFPSPSQPLSLVSHWLLLHHHTPTHNASSSISLVSHCVTFPNPEDEEKPNDEGDFKRWMAEFREQLRADRIKIIAELKKDFSLLKNV